MAKVLPEWFEGELGGSLQRAYDLSTDGSIVLDSPHGSVDLRGASGTWDAPILTAGFTGSQPTTVVTALSAKLATGDSSVEHALHSAVMAGTRGVIRGESNNTVIIGGDNNLAEELAIASSIISSDNARVSLANRSSIQSTEGFTGATNSDFIQTDVANKFDISMAIATGTMPGYSGISEIRGASQYSEGPIYSYNTVLQSSKHVMAHYTDSSLINSSTYSLIEGTDGYTGSVYLDNPELFPIYSLTQSVPARNAHIGSSRGSYIGGMVQNASISASSSSAITQSSRTFYVSEFYNSDTNQYLTASSSITASDKAWIDNASGSHIGSSHEVRIMALDERSVNNVSVQSSEKVLANYGSNNSVVSSYLVNVGNLVSAGYPDNVSATEIIDATHVSVDSSSTINVHNSYGIFVGASREVSVSSDVYDYGSGNKNLKSKCSAVIASLASSSMEGSESSIITASSGDNMGLGAPSGQPRLGVMQIIQSGNSAIIASRGDADRLSYVGHSKMSLIEASRSGESGNDMGITGANISLMSTSEGCNLISSTSSQLASSLSSYQQYGMRSELRAASSTNLGMIPSGFTGAYSDFMQGVVTPPISNPPVNGYALTNTETIVSATRANTYVFANTTTMVEAQTSSSVGPFNHNFGALAGSNLTAMYCDDTAVLGGRSLEVGPFSHQSVFGGGQSTRYSEVMLSTGLANHDSDFRESIGGMFVGNLASSSLRTIRGGAVLSSESRVEESTETLVTGSRYTEVTNGLRNSVQSSTAINSDHDVNSSVVSSMNSNMSNNTGSVLIATYAGDMAYSSTSALIGSSAVAMRYSDRSAGIAVSESSIWDSNEAVIMASRHSHISEYSHNSSIFSSTSSSVVKSSNAWVRGSVSGSVNEFSHQSGIDGSFDSSMYNSEFSHVGNSRGISIQSSNTYAGVNSSDGGTLQANAFFAYDSSRTSGTLYGNSFGAMQSSDDSTIINSNFAGFSSNASVSANNLVNSHVLSSYTSIVRVAYLSSVKSAENTTAKSLNTSSIDGARDSEMIDVTASGIASTSGAHMFGCYASSVVGSYSDNYVYNSSAASVRSSGDSVISNSFNTSIDSSSFVNANSVSRSLVASSSYVNVDRSSEVVVLASSQADSSNITRVQDSYRSAIIASSQLNYMTFAKDTLFAASNQCTVDNTTQSLMLASYASTSSESNGSVQMGTSFCYIRPHSDYSSISQSYSASVSGYSDHASIANSYESTITEMSGRCLIQSSSNSTVSGNTQGSVIIAMDRGVITGYSHNSLMGGGREHLMAAFCEESVILGGEQNVMTNAVRASGMVGGRRNVANGSEMLFMASSEDCQNIDSHNSTITSSRQCRMSGSERSRISSGFSGAIGNGAISCVLENSVSSDILGSSSYSTVSSSESVHAVGAVSYSDIRSTKNASINNSSHMDISSSENVYMSNGNTYVSVDSSKGVTGGMGLSYGKASASKNVKLYGSGLMSTVGAVEYGEFFMGNNCSMSAGYSGTTFMAHFSGMQSFANGRLSTTNYTTLDSSTDSILTSTSKAHVQSSNGIAMTSGSNESVDSSEYVTLSNSSKSKVSSSSYSDMVGGVNSSMEAGMSGHMFNAPQTASMQAFRECSINGGANVGLHNVSECTAGNGTHLGIYNSNDSEVVDTSNATVIGSIGAKASHKSEIAHANGKFESRGDAQSSSLILRGFTDDSGITGQSLLLNGITGIDVSAQYNLAPNSTYSIKAQVVAKGYTGAIGAVQHFDGIITTDESFVDTSSVLASYTGCSNDNLLQGVNVDVGATGLLFDIVVPSTAGIDTRWMAQVAITKVSF